MGGGRSTHVGMRNAHKMFVGKHEKKRLLGRPRCMWLIIFKRLLNRVRGCGLDACISE